MCAKIKTELIDNYRKDNNLTVEQFCKKCRISKRAYYKLMRGELSIRITTYLKILNELHVYSNDLLDING